MKAGGRVRLKPRPSRAGRCLSLSQRTPPGRGAFQLPSTTSSVSSRVVVFFSTSARSRPRVQVDRLRDSGVAHLRRRARRVAEIAAATASTRPDPFLQVRESIGWRSSIVTRGLRLAVARDEDLYFTDAAAREGFAEARARLEAMGVLLEPIDMSPFYEAGQLLYGGSVGLRTALSGGD